MEGYIAILKQRIYTKRLPSSFHVLDYSFERIEKMLTSPILHQDKRATLLSQCQKLIAQFKYDLITLDITTAEEIVRCHANVIANEKKKLVDRVGGQVPLPKSFVAILNGIAARQSNIIKRSQLITQRKLSFFDDAPMVLEEAAGHTIGATI